MSVSNFPTKKPDVPATVANLDHTVVVEALARHACNVTDASLELKVPASDLRRLMWANPGMQDQAFETVEARLDIAEKNIAEALSSDDSRRRDAASFFVVRNTARAKRRGWIVSASSGVDVTINANLPPRQIVYRWRTDDDDKRDAEAVEAERLRDEGKLIEHEANPEPSNKD
jgi:hypothetical protein